MGDTEVQAPTLPVDPNLATEQQQAQDNLIAALQTQAAGDSASLMARYGTRLAMAGMQGTSALQPAVSPARTA